MLNKAAILNLLETNDKAVARALVVLNERQTLDEQQSEHTKHHNNRGFRPCHARMGTSMAKFFERNGYLTAKQIAYWRKTDRAGNMRIGIYWGQLIDAATAKAAMQAERMMQRMEAEADYSETLRDEVSKRRIREIMEAA